MAEGWQRLTEFPDLILRIIPITEIKGNKFWPGHDLLINVPKGIPIVRELGLSKSEL